MLVREKIEQAKGILKEFGVDCWLTFVRESQINGDPVLAFILGAEVTWHSAFIITAAGETRAIVGRYDKRTVEDTGVYGEVVDYVEGIREPFLETMKFLDPARIAVNFSKESEICDGLTHGMYLTLHDLLSEIGLADRIVSAEKIVSALRQRKTAVELGRIREAIAATERIFDDVGAFIEPGRREKEIAAFMQDATRRAGLGFAWEERVCPAVFTGPDTAGAHYGPTDRAVERGHVLNMDFGVKVEGYCSDMQRSFYVLEEGEKVPPADVQAGFDTIIAAVEAARRTLKPGALGRDVDAAARKVVVSAGYEEFPHGLGHQVGRFAHDGTALLGPSWEKYAGKVFEPIEEGMVFTLEPRLFVPGRGTVTIEEMVLVAAGGAEFLSTPQKEPLLVPPKA